MERVSEVRRGLIEDEGMTEAEADEEIAGEPVVARKGEPLLNAIPPLEMGVSLAHAAANLGITLTPEVEEFGRQFEALMQTERRGPCGTEAKS